MDLQYGAGLLRDVSAVQSSPVSFSEDSWRDHIAPQRDLVQQHEQELRPLLSEASSRGRSDRATDALSKAIKDFESALHQLQQLIVEVSSDSPSFNLIAELTTPFPGSQ